MSEIKYPPKLKTLSIVPDFELKSTSDKTISVGQFKQRKSLVLYFFGKTNCKPCKQKLIEYQSIASKIEYYNALLFAVSPADIKSLTSMKENLGVPFEFLSDDGLVASNTFTHLKPNTAEPIPSLFIIDRYNTLYAQWLVENEEELPSNDEMLKVLRAIEIECPECGYFPGSTSV